ncbi:hypothetical protein FHT40_000956 [Mycolicibacterium sp. BK556]|uniref:hypothetical protein n=1 Tax=unclassified Mycolicibacterium TaxID=2636767 RepID=UPI001613F263|nr:MULTISPECIES: hypothetical protein [unclassified Mycolicibacterium]MBB3601323.1 hypothetical protein [Mycolicibacterium sp. BK556]MBB3631075.1 hypothetical protein [Mycolicibacterium sp. BK607]
MFDEQIASQNPAELLAAITEFDRREKGAAALQLVLLGELVRRWFNDISLEIQGTPLPAHSSYGPTTGRDR